MRTKTWTPITVIAFVLIAVFTCSYVIFAGDKEEHRTGVKIPTPEQMEIFKQTRPKVIQVLPNKLAIERVNKELADQGIPKVSEAQTVPRGKETIAAVGGKTGKPIDPLPIVVPSGTTTIPNAADNSALPAFPEIRDQGNQNSCASLAVTYYQMTHMTGLIYGWDNHNANNTTKFSPRWSYNMLNDGIDTGTDVTDQYDLIERNGACTWTEFPYDGVEFKQWVLDPVVWQNAIKYRTNPLEYIDTSTPAGVSQLKQLLANGDIITFLTFISNWQYSTVKDDTSTPDDNPFVGQQICYWLSGQTGGHMMNIVGYNDAIWVDINKNRRLDPGEKGAFKIANSWGTTWKNSGFCWLAYDALNAVSQVSGGPSTNRVPAFMFNVLFRTSAKDHYLPKVVAEFTVNHAKRDQLRMNVGVSDTSSSLPTTTWYPGAIALQGGSLAFDGTTIARDGIFVLDFTDILPPGNAEKRYYLGMFDSVTGDTASLSSFKLKDLLNNQEIIATTTPQSVDNGQVNAYLDYIFVDNTLTNNPPVAVISTTPSPATGNAPLQVNFDGQGSYDTGGSIASYRWYFGDGEGSFANGATASYTYPVAGIYNAVLTVTDNLGATSSSAVIVTATGNQSAIMHISNIAMQIKTQGQNKYAAATVTILNGLGAPVSGATVSGHWSGLTSDTDTGTTNTSGQVTLNSNAISKSTAGTFTFCVDTVVKAGNTYNPSANVMTCNSIYSGPL